MAEHGAMWRGESPVQQAKPLGLLGFADKFWPLHRLQAKALDQPIVSMTKGDEIEAFAMYAGHFNFQGESLMAQAAHIFAVNSGSKAFQKHLHTLQWLKHFAASNRTLHAHYALRLLGRWAKSGHKFSGVDDLTHIIIALAGEGQILASRCEAQLQAEFLEIASNTVQKLHSKSTHNAEAAVSKAIGLLYACAAFSGLEELRKAAGDLLAANIEKLILPDGGHISFQAEPLIARLAQLLPLLSHRLSLPQQAVHAIDRMLPMLRMISFGNKQLSGLRGSYQNLDLVKSLLVHAVAKPLQHAPQTGLVRFETKALTCLADTRDHFGLELAIGQNPVFKNAVITTRSKGPQIVLRHQAEGSLLQMSDADGHGRICFLSANGSDFRVEDHYSMPFQIVFDFNAEVKISILRDGAAILCVTPDRQVWQLSVRGAKAVLEAHNAIAINGNASTRINWAFKKQQPTIKPQSRQQRSTAQLLV